jgi:hypothetical protein
MPRMLLLRNLLLRTLVSDVLLSGGGIKPSTAVKAVESSPVSGVARSPPGEVESPNPGGDGTGGGSVLASCSLVSVTRMGCGDSWKVMLSCRQ